MNVIENTLGDCMRRARKAAKLTQEKVAVEIGVSPARVSRWESGDDYPRINEYRRFIEITEAEELADLRILPSCCIAA